jgi:DNA-binding FadR family transcriptional regulator
MIIININNLNIQKNIKFFTVISQQSHNQAMVDLKNNVMSQFAKQTVSKAKESMGIESTTDSQDGGNGEGPINW